MSNAVYPTPALGGGPAYSVIKTPNWATRMQRSVSGRVLRTSDFINPIWHFTLKYEVLDDGSAWSATALNAPTDLRVIMDFFNARAGAFDSFLFTDPTDNSVLDVPLAADPTDTTGTIFHLARPLAPGGLSEWITAPNNVSAVYLDGSSTIGYSLDPDTGLITFDTAPGEQVATADFTYYFRVYFPDSLDFENFSYQLWELKQVKLTSLVAGL